MSEESGVLRLNKYLSQAGCGTRKETVELIKKSLVTVNDVVVKEPFYEVKLTDVIKLHNKVILPKVSYIYALINKSQRSPVISDEKNEAPSLQDLTKKWHEAPLKPLNHPTDDCCGLVVMTNDLDLLSKLDQPGHKIKSVYEVTVDVDIDQEVLDNLITQTQEKGLRVLGLGFPNASQKTILGLELMGGSFADVYALFQRHDLKINKVDCTFYGGLTKKDLKRGWSRLLTEKEEVFIKHFS
jgi:23S rRNA pseudouridine2605 synthase